MYVCEGQEHASLLASQVASISIVAGEPSLSPGPLSVTHTPIYTHTYIHKRKQTYSVLE